MKKFFFVFIFFVFSLSANMANYPILQVRHVCIDGYVGQRINDCLCQRVKAQEVDELVNVFRNQNEVHNLWGSEFWGKWVQGAIAFYRYNGDSSLYKKIKESEENIMDCQLSDGYIGNYDMIHQLQGWDIWGRKYCCLGLLKWYELSGDKRALKAASRLIDYTITQIGMGGIPIYETGNFRGMASSSILEPVMFLYKDTKKKKYLDFAKFIVKTDETENGPQLIAKANIPVYSRFPVQKAKDWFSKINGQKAYEMMSCYVGLLELYKATGDDSYLATVEKVVKNIEDEEINICGSGSACECWMRGGDRQTQPTYHSMETCVGFTWMQINERLLQITENSHYADNIEKTFYNAILAAMKNDGSQIAKYTPLEGFRQAGEKQCGLNINCCNANGPRAFAMIPRITYHAVNDERVDINFYVPSSAEIELNRNSITLTQSTDYPKTGLVNIAVNPTKKKTFAIALRIPKWCKTSKVLVNGQEQAKVISGTYFVLNREWAKGDKIELYLDVSARLLELNHMQALVYGPIVLARDSRFNDGFVDETCVIPNVNGMVDAKLVKSPKDMWMTFEVQAKTGTDMENSSKDRTLHFCDFASAGDTWNASTRYRVWLNKTLNPMIDPK